ncbi:MAG: precorrin-2 C(20)-methyltransferase [Thermodesulfovibrionales bacterium]|nr:precorrin-2 C(20)-methyltransferase [Thermodesulfovibrionales bacterium]
MIGTLYSIGVGPGDPELITLKALKILKEAPCLCVPKGREEGTSIALEIVSKVFDIKDKEIIEAHFPMKKTKSPEHMESLDKKWNETVENILNRLRKGLDIAFITIGDPSIYSTFYYLYDRLLELQPDLQISIIPGISSINASAAKAGVSLGLADEKIAIIPTTYTDNLKTIFETFDTIVLMKVHKVMDKILSLLDELKLTEKSIYISKVGMKDEYICKDLSKLNKEELNYFSILIVKK